MSAQKPPMARKSLILVVLFAMLLYVALALAFGQFGATTLFAAAGGFLVSVVLITVLYRIRESKKDGDGGDESEPRKATSEPPGGAHQFPAPFRSIRVLALTVLFQPIIIAALFVYLVGGNEALLMTAGAVLGILGSLGWLILWLTARQRLARAGFRW
jgi:high-affinity Fe2+/Pb2+ permease